ncbi:GIY-YIG nuclease family protein [Pseudolysinimonas sp.]|uniref:GIY-YIG nuclease family protein n=1 Tax=Pseudolysinimonas sp. TaxID=2680009 RepID=UPI00286B9646|nr:GIY-YIG nuclease family protein [Pseudolysinimonas sp.]
MNELESPCRVCWSRSGIRTPTGWVCAVCGWRVGEYIDPGLPLPRINVVYYVRLGERVKIGTTFNPRQRFAALLHEEVLAFERGDRTLEQRRHVEFADDRLGTSEWFALTPRLAAHIDALEAGIDPWHTHARWLADALRELS